MPEVSEVAHVVALLRRNILNYKIKDLKLKNDSLLFPDLSKEDPELFLSQLNDDLVGSEVEAVRRHGKYFWIRLRKAQSSSVLLMHFGMTGMIKLQGVQSHLVLMENGGDKKFIDIKTGAKIAKVTDPDTAGEWPPKFCKFEMTLSGQDKELDLAFVDPRRLGRIRYLKGADAETDEGLFKISPLSALGPDYSKKSNKDVKLFSIGDPDPNNHGVKRLDLVEFSKLVKSKKSPIKSFLLDQKYFAGIGNWVSDEITFQAKIHPYQVINQYPEHIIDVKIEDLYNAIIDVCETSVKLEGDAKQFPSHWLMLYRWGKRRKSVKSTTAGGHEVDFITIGGRTSCFVPELQKLSADQTIKASTSKTDRKTKRPSTVGNAEDADDNDYDDSKVPKIKTRMKRRKE